MKYHLVRRHSAIGRVRSSANSWTLKLASLAATLTVLFLWPPLAAAAQEGFVVSPGGAPRFAGPGGGEGNVAEIFATAEQTGGVWGVWGYTAEPKFGPPLHIHRDEDEFFYVLNGEFALQLGDCVKIAPAGSFAYIPKNVEHTYRNIRDTPGELLGVVTPGGFEGFFAGLPGADPETVEALAKKHAMDSVGPPIDLTNLPPSRAAADGKRAPLPANAFRIGVLSPGCSPPAPLFRTLLQGLRDLGYTEGENVSIEWRYSKGKSEDFANLAAELAHMDVDVIVAMSTPAALAAKRATRTTPIVMLYVADPKGTGLVASLAQPGGNITGVSDMATDLSAKRLALLKEVVPTLSRVAVIWNASDPGMALRFKEIQSAAQMQGVTLQSVEVRHPGDFEDAFAKLTREPPDALFLVAEVLTIRHRCRVLKFAEKNQLPAIYEFGLFARDGGLMAYGPKLTESFERGAYYVDKILKGMKPMDLPVEQPKSFELHVNLTTAQALGLVISPSILMQADHTEVGGVGQCARMW